MIADTPQTKQVEGGVDGSKLKKTFNVREDLVGEVIEATEDAYAIRFARR